MTFCSTLVRPMQTYSPAHRGEKGVLKPPRNTRTDTTMRWTLFFWTNNLRHFFYILLEVALEFFFGHEIFLRPKSPSKTRTEGDHPNAPPFLEKIFRPPAPPTESKKRDETTSDHQTHHFAPAGFSIFFLLFDSVGGAHCGG